MYASSDLRAVGIDPRLSHEHDCSFILQATLDVSALQGKVEIGTLAQLDSYTPCLYLDFPNGRAKLRGYRQYVQNNIVYVSLQCTGYICFACVRIHIIFMVLWYLPRALPRSPSAVWFVVTCMVYMHALCVILVHVGAVCTTTHVCFVW